MRNADYWRGRFSILEDSAHREAQKTIQDMEELYLDAQRSVQKEIESWYARFAVNNQISLTDARKWLTAGQLEEFHWSVEQYIKIGEQAGLDAAWLKKLENASTRFHISRLEAVQTGIQQQLELLYGNQVDSLDALLKKVVGNGYTHTAFEVQKGVGLGWDITGLNQKKLETLLSKPWTTDGRTFRDRCWLNKNDLVGSVSKNLTQGLLRGDSPSKITTAIQKQFGVHRYKAGRLVNTETTYFNAVATKECYKDLDVEMVEIIETLDSHTCSICGGLDGKVIPISQYEPGVTVPPFHPIKNSQKIFGYAYTADELKPMREIFLHAKTVHFFRLGSSGVKASNTYATAKYPGTRGNDLRVVITANENSTEQKPLFDVETFLGTVQVDLQEGVAAITGLKANDYLDWKSSGTLSLTASLPLTGGTNGTVADSDYQTYLDQAEAYTFNAMGCTESKATITALFAAFAKRMRDDVGKKFQVVLFRKLADYEGVVSVKNGLTSDKTSTALIPWVTGVIGGTAVNKSATNMTYDGEYDVDTDFTQTQLENGIREGSFMFHRVDEAVCVLTDINSFISITDEKSSDFSSNQTIRVLDQIANDIAVLFGKKYLGKVPNDAAGRISLWNDIVKHHTELQDIRAIENFSGENVTVEKGDTKKSVVVTDYVTPVNAMEQLYMTVYVQ